METNTEHKIEKFNFFKRLEISNQTKTGFFIAFLKIILKPISYFVIFPASLYMLFKTKFPQQSLNIANEISTIPSQDVVSLLLVIFGAFLAIDLIKQTISTTEDGQKIGKEFTSIWLPFAKALEVLILLYLVPVTWSIIWPHIK